MRVRPKLLTPTVRLTAPILARPQRARRCGHSPTSLVLSANQPAGSALKCPASPANHFARSRKRRRRERTPWGMVKGAQASVFPAFCDLADGDFFAYRGVPYVAHGEATAIFRCGSSKAQGKKLASRRWASSPRWPSRPRAGAASDRRAAGSRARCRVGVRAGTKPRLHEFREAGGRVSSTSAASTGRSGSV
jgi:hypothetical protein